MNSKETFIQYSRLLYDRGLVSGSGGNISMRCGQRILVTPSGHSLRDILENDVVIMEPEGRVVGGGTPSKDVNVHLAILRCRPEIGVVCHIHGAHIIAASTLLKPGADSLPPITPGFTYFAYPLKMIPFMVPGSEELTRAVKEHFAGSETPALLLQNHGLITIGKNFQTAINIAEEIDEVARIWLLTKGRAGVIPKAEVDRIKSL